MAIRNRLEHWLHARELNIAELGRLAAVPQRTLRGIIKGSQTRIDFGALDRICAVLMIQIGDLLIREADDIWVPILASGKVTIHYGSRIYPGAPRKGGRTSIPLHYVGTWDDKTKVYLRDYLGRRNGDVRISEVEHMVKSDRASLETLCNAIMSGGNHIVIGSNLSDVMAEYIMCRMFGAAPGVERDFVKFPYGFVWQPDRWASSAFGRPATDESGIWCNQTNSMVAYQDFVEVGDGPDCGLVTVLRHRPVQANGAWNERPERVVIVLTGHSGPGTLAAAQIATDPRLASEIYPSAFDVPLSRAFRATYNRPEPSELDNRVVTSRELVPLPTKTDKAA